MGLEQAYVRLAQERIDAALRRLRLQAPPRSCGVVRSMLGEAKELLAAAVDEADRTLPARHAAIVKEDIRAVAQVLLAAYRSYYKTCHGVI